MPGGQPFRIPWGRERTPAQRVINAKWAVFGAALYMIAAGFAGWSVWLGPDNGLPPYHDLQRVDGRLEKIEIRGRDVTLTLAGQERRFVYIAKAGNLGAVEDALATGQAITLWTEPAEAAAGRDIFQLQADGRMVRSYADVRDAWRADNAIAPYMLMIFLVGATWLSLSAWRTLRKYRRRNGLEDADEMRGR